MIKPKITLSDAERAFILEERGRTKYSAEFVSEKIGKSKSWLAQIENGRTKTIRRDDFIKLISFLRNDTDLIKIEAFIQASMIAITNNLPAPTSPDDEKIKSFIDNNDCNREGLNKPSQEWCGAMICFFKNVYAHYKDKNELETVLYNILYNLHSNPSIALSVMGSPINRLTNTSKEIQSKFFKEFFLT